MAGIRSEGPSKFVVLELKDSADRGKYGEVTEGEFKPHAASQV